MPGDTSGLTRRDILKGVSVGAVSSLTGCPDQGDTPTETQTDTIGPPATPTPTIECPPVDYNLNTGFDHDAGGKIPVSNSDPQWKITADDTGGVVPRDAIVVGKNHPFLPGWSDAFDDSLWIGPSDSGYYGSLSIKDTEEFEYQYCFCLNEGFELPRLHLQIRADDEVEEIRLNGTPLPFVGAGSHHGAPVTETYTSPSLFKSGENCLTVVVADTEGRATGINLLGTVTAENADCECETGACDLGIDKYHEGAFTFGELGAYFIEVCNQGDAECTEAVEVEDELPPGTTFDGSSGPGWTVTQSGSTLTLTHPNADGLAPGECLPAVQITIQIPTFGEFPGGNALSNCATLVSGGVHSDNDRDCDTACIQGNHTFHGGSQDNFGGNSEPASPSKGLQQKFGPLRAYDGYGMDKHFGDTFESVRPSEAVGEVCQATLEICLRPVGTDPAHLNENDSLQLGVWDANGNPVSPIWSRTLGNYAGDPGLFDTVWNPQHTEPRCITLDLSALPEVGGSTLNLTGAINNNDRLSVHVQDDTVVDYADLHVTYCCTGTGTGEDCDLTIEKTTADEFHFGGQGTYYINVCNEGAGGCERIEVTDELPAGMQLVSGAGSGWSVSSQGGTVTATHAGPSPGDCLPTLSLTVEVAPIDEFPAGADRVENCAKVDDIEDCVPHVITPQ